MRKIILFIFQIFFVLFSCAQCPDLLGAIVNSCGASEGNNEFVIFTTAVTANASTYAVKYGTATPPTSNTMSGSDATSITGPGSVTGAGCTVVNIVNPATSIPAGSKVIMIPAGLDQAYDVTSLCGGGSIYVIYIKINSAGGLNSNWTASGTLANTPASARFLQITYSGNPSCSNANAPVKSYTNAWASNTDGNFVTWNGTTPAYTNNGCTNIILPITLTGFSVSNNNNKHILSWKTEQETNSKQFEVEKSYDGINFLLIGIVPASGNSSSEKFYSFLNPAVEIKNAYYRLKMVDINGKSVYSDIIYAITRNTNLGLSNIYPIPAFNNVNVEWIAADNRASQLLVIDITGRVIKQQQLKNNIGFNKLAVDLKNIPAGEYFLKLITGNKVSTKILTKQ